MNSHLKFKNHLKEFRRAAGLNQTQLAALLCVALGCRFEELFCFEEN